MVIKMLIKTRKNDNAKSYKNIENNCNNNNNGNYKSIIFFEWIILGHFASQYIHIQLHKNKQTNKPTAN